MFATVWSSVELVSKLDVSTKTDGITNNTIPNRLAEMLLCQNFRTIQPEAGLEMENFLLEELYILVA